MCEQEVSELRMYQCLECGIPVSICSRCDRGHIQCRPCSLSRVRRHRTFRAASKRHQSTPRGKLNHRNRQRRFMERKRAMTQHTSQTISERAPSSTLEDDREVVASESDRNIFGKPGYYRCHYCRRAISRAHLTESFGKYRRRQRHDRQRNRGRDQAPLLC
jgi:hypothetical protein